MDKGLFGGVGDLHAATRGLLRTCRKIVIHTCKRVREYLKPCVKG